MYGCAWLEVTAGGWMDRGGAPLSGTGNSDTSKFTTHDKKLCLASLEHCVSGSRG